MDIAYDNCSWHTIYNILYCKVFLYHQYFLLKDILILSLKQIDPLLKISLFQKVARLKEKYLLLWKKVAFLLMTTNCYLICLRLYLIFYQEPDIYHNKLFLKK